MFKSISLLLFTMGTAAALLPAQVCAQGQPIRLVVPYAAAGPADMVARVLSEKLRQQGVQNIVDNRAGADGAIGTVAVAQGPADGSVFLFAGAGLFTVNQHMKKSLPYDPVRDFAPVNGVAYADVVFVVSPSIPANSLKEFIAYAKAARPPIALASGGTGTTTHLFLELLRDSGGFEFLHVPYKGSAPALTDVMGGQTAGTITALSITLSNIRAGKLKALAMMGTQRSPAAPDIPTFGEQGVGGLDVVSWLALMAPHNTPATAIASLSKETIQALHADDVRAKLQGAGITTWPVPSAELATIIRTESERWKKIITDRKLGEAS